MLKYVVILLAHRPHYGPDMRHLPTSVRCPFVPTPVVISRKLNKIGPLLLWKTIRKFTSLILLLPADPPTDALPCGDIRVSNKIVFKYY